MALSSIWGVAAEVGSYWKSVSRYPTYTQAARAQTDDVIHRKHTAGSPKSPL
jgi:hypothetical protein